MFYHQIFAQIQNNIVHNIIVCKDYNTANVLTKNIYGKDAIAVDCTYWACATKDTYKDNKFYSPNGELREYKGSEVENIDKLKNENEIIKQENLDSYEKLLDTQYELEQAKDNIVENLEAQIDLEFRVSQLEDK